MAESRFVVTNARAQSELVQLVVDFEPGAWTSLHTHGGQAIKLVLEGRLLCGTPAWIDPISPDNRGAIAPARFMRQRGGRR